MKWLIISIFKYRHPFHFIATFLWNYDFAPGFSKNYDFTTRLKISYIYHNLTKNFLITLKKQTYKSKFLEQKLRSSIRKQLIEVIFLSNLIIWKLKKKINESHRSARPDPGSVAQNCATEPGSSRGFSCDWTEAGSSRFLQLNFF